MRYEILNFNFTLLIQNIDKSNFKYFIFQDQYYSDKWNKVNDKKTQINQLINKKIDSRLVFDENFEKQSIDYVNIENKFYKD